ncbi:MAG: ribosome biogenesis GTP-binding protein YihA/YsxC [Acidobacteriota bacterium]
MKIDDARLALSAHTERMLLRDGRPEVVFAGRSNVGKSSLLNRLLGRKDLAHTGSKPGRTRSVNYFLINDRLYFVDLPGYGYAKAAKQERRRWAELIDHYLRQALPGALVVLLVDTKVGATELDIQAYEYLDSLGGDIQVVATKCDRVPRGKRSKMLAEVRRTLDLDSTTRVVPVSARTGDGIKELWSVIAQRALSTGAEK